jgi:methylene-fatty-acyl-phospholipid synthase
MDIDLDGNRYKLALEDQPVHPLLQTEAAKLAAVMLFATGNLLVLSSMWALGVTGTYLGKRSIWRSFDLFQMIFVALIKRVITGDYFGILMSERVTSFPFNVCENPMYVGSTLTFLATAIWYVLLLIKMCVSRMKI